MNDEIRLVSELSGDTCKNSSGSEIAVILTYRADDGKLYRTTYYNSKVIIRVGTMLKSPECA
ncbi:MAG: hypothetical protein LBI63_02840 [Candidatus Ancillula sp.]|jgi:hypothetical protein|nr:hypothetical protein [Candidatus Ancillula sp.]